MFSGIEETQKKINEQKTRTQAFRFYTGENKGNGFSMAELEAMTWAERKHLAKGNLFGGINMSSGAAEVAANERKVNPHLVKMFAAFDSVSDVSVTTAAITSQPTTVFTGDDEGDFLNEKYLSSRTSEMSKTNGHTVNMEMLIEKSGAVTIPFDYEMTEKTKLFFRSTRCEGPWTAPVTAVMGSLLLSDGERDSYLRSMIATTEKYVLSNGGLFGQFKRIENTNAVGNKYRALFPEASRCGTAALKADYIKLVLQSWPVNVMTLSIKDLYGKLATINGFDPDLDINKKASSGPGYPIGTKREASYVTDVTYTNTQLAKMSQLDTKLQEDAFYPIPDEHLAMLNFYDESMSVWVKPKFEVMKRANLMEKVRNIYVFPSFAQVSVGKACSVFNGINSQPFQNGGSSLKGFDPFYSKIDNVVRHLKVNSFGFYSDNMYFYDRDTETLHSLDVEKMESTSTPSEGTAFMEFLLDCLGDGLKASVLGDFLIQTGGTWAHDRRGQLNTYTGRVVGLMSGSQTTFLINHFRMARATSIVRNNVKAFAELVNATADGKSIVLPKEWKIYFNLEKTSSTSSKKSSNPGEMDPKSKYVNFREAESHAGTLTDFGPIVHLDMLGFDATTVHIPDDPKFEHQAGRVIYVACLDFERLMKAIMYRKPTVVAGKNKLSKVDELGQTVVTIFIQLMTLQALFLAGGFAYPTTHDILRNTYMLQRDNAYNALDKLMNMINAPQMDSPVMIAHLENLIAMASKAVATDADDDIDIFQGDSRLMAYNVVQTFVSGEDNETALRKFMTRKNVIVAYHTYYGSQVRAQLKRDNLKLKSRKHTRGAISNIFGYEFTAQHKKKQLLEEVRQLRGKKERVMPDLADDEVSDSDIQPRAKQKVEVYDEDSEPESEVAEIQPEPMPLPTSQHRAEREKPAPTKRARSEESVMQEHRNDYGSVGPIDWAEPAAPPSFIGNQIEL